MDWLMSFPFANPPNHPNSAYCASEVQFMSLAFALFSSISASHQSPNPKPKKFPTQRLHQSDSHDSNYPTGARRFSSADPSGAFVRAPGARRSPQPLAGRDGRPTGRNLDDSGRLDGKCLMKVSHRNHWIRYIPLMDRVVSQRFSSDSLD